MDLRAGNLRVHQDRELRLAEKKVWPLSDGWVENRNLKGERIKIGRGCIATDSIFCSVGAGRSLNDKKNGNLDFEPGVRGSCIRTRTFLAGIQILVEKTLTVTHCNRFLFIDAKNFGDIIPVQLKV